MVRYFLVDGTRGQFGANTSSALGKGSPAARRCLKTWMDLVRRVIRRVDLRISRWASSIAVSQVKIFIDLDKFSIDIDKVPVYHVNVLIRKEDLFHAQYRSTLMAADRERAEIRARLAQIQSEAIQLADRLRWLDATIEALQPLCQTEQEEEDVPHLDIPHLAAFCSHVLSNLNRPATAPEIRTLIAPMIDLSRYPNPLAVIHTTLGRMAGVTRFKGEDGKTYFTVGPPQVISPEGLG